MLLSLWIIFIAFIPYFLICFICSKIFSKERAMTAVVIIYALYIALLFLGKMYVDHIKFQNCPCQHFDQITLLRRGGLSEKEISEHYRNFFSEAGWNKKAIDVWLLENSLPAELSTQ